MKLARTLGISKRRLEGWEPIEETEVTEWTADGRPAKWTTRREAEFSDEDEGWFLALAQWEASLCPCGCGHPLAESTAAENDERYRVERVRCHARTALVIAAEKAQENKAYRPEGFLYSTRLIRR